MLAKIWKKLLLITVIVLCIWNIVAKLTHKISFDRIIGNVKQKIETAQNTNTLNN